jgi:hypothetical protein
MVSWFAWRVVFNDFWIGFADGFFDGLVDG